MPGNRKTSGLALCTVLCFPHCLVLICLFLRVFFTGFSEMCIEDIFSLSFPNICDCFLSFCRKVLYSLFFKLKEFKMFSFWWLRVEITFMILVLLVWFKAISKKEIFLFPPFGYVQKSLILIFIFKTHSI